MINLSGNQINLLPNEICFCPNLKTLNLMGNRIIALPARMQQMKQFVAALEDLEFYMGCSPTRKTERKLMQFTRRRPWRKKF